MGLWSSWSASVRNVGVQGRYVYADEFAVCWDLCIIRLGKEFVYVGSTVVYKV